MNANTVLLLLILLQIINYVIIFTYWIKYGSKGIMLSILLIFVINISVLIIYTRVNKPQKSNLKDTIGTIIGTAMLLGISLFLLTIAGCIVGYKLAEKNGLEKIVGIFLPIISTGILLMSVSLNNRLI
jgi:hypothetical protein